MLALGATLFLRRCQKGLTWATRCCLSGWQQRVTSRTTLGNGACRTSTRATAPPPTLCFFHFQFQYFNRVFARRVANLTYHVIAFAFAGTWDSTRRSTPRLDVASTPATGFFKAEKTIGRIGAAHRKLRATSPGRLPNRPGPLTCGSRATVTFQALLCSG